MIFPFINQHFDIITGRPLRGVGGNTKPVFTWQGWWDGTYQQGLEKHCNDSIGFRPDMIRTVNQVNFSIFKELNTSNVILGHHNNLIYWDYISAYYGDDYAGDNFPMESMRKLKKIQDTLEKMGKLFVMVHAGSKASYFAEDIPDYLPRRADGKNNLNNYIRVADSFGIHQINFNAWIASLKGKKERDLFNKQGIHWNLYGAYFAIDSLISYIENVKKIQMQHPHIVSIEHSYEARYDEDDIEHQLNLIYPVDTTAYWYPQIQYDTSDNLAKPRMIYIGDSFNNTFLFDGILNVGTDAQYWYYFQTAVKKNWFSKPIDEYDWKGALEQADCIVMMYTATQLVIASPDFINKVYDHYYPGK